MDFIANDLLIVDRRRGGYFAGDNCQTGRNERFTRNASRWVLLKDCIQDRV